MKITSLLGLLILTQVAVARTIHVSPNGKDEWSGNLSQPRADGSDGPLATLARARDIIRGWKSSGRLDESVRIIIAMQLEETT